METKEIIGLIAGLLGAVLFALLIATAYYIGTMGDDDDDE